MAWSASSGSTRSPRDDGNYMIGLALSRRSLLPEFHKERNRKQSHQFVVKDEIEEDELSDELSSPTQKKRRLTADQVKFLETSFSMDTKLEPERKALLAEMLGIRPRQVAIWFQNRRARGKCKQLEREFEQLKVAFETVTKETENLSLERESVLEENKRLQTEVLRLRDLLEKMTNSKTSDTMGILPEGKSELTSPTKSGADQSDIQDSNQSCLVQQAATGIAAAVPALSELNPGLLCSVNLKMDSDHIPVFQPDEYFGPSNFSLCCHSSYFEDTLLANYADYHFDVLTCHEHLCPSGD